MSEAVRPVESTLTLDASYFDECTFIRRADPAAEDGNIAYEFNFNRGIEKIDDEHYRVSLRANVKTKNDEVEIHTRIVGKFSIKSDDERQRDVLIKKNTVAILFPYVRSQIILVTSQSGIPPVVLPVVNIAEMFPDEPLERENKE